MAVSKKVYLARAVPVDPAVLAAALVGYIETKATLTTFFLCGKYARNSSVPLGKLPFEILREIAIVYRDVIYHEALREWKPGFNCMTRDCITRDYTSLDERERLLKELSEDEDLSGDISYDSDDSGCKYFHHGHDVSEIVDTKFMESESWWDEHDKRATAFREEIENETSKLSKYRDVFESDSGIKLHFNWVPVTDEEDPDLDSGILEAFVMLALQEFPIDEKKGRRQASFSLMGQIKTPALRPLSETQVTSIEQALRKLDLGRLVRSTTLDDQNLNLSYMKTYFSALSGEQRLANMTQKLILPREEDEAEQWPALWLLGCATLDAW